MPRLSKRARSTEGEPVAEPVQPASAAPARPQPGSRGAPDTGERIREIIVAAEQAAQKVLEDAEERLRQRVAEGDRAAEYRVQAAEEEAAEILEAARRNAERLLADAHQSAADARADSDEQARRLLSDARATADGVRGEGLELVGNLREMGNSLRANAERLLSDIQRIHSRMVGEIEAAGGGKGRSNHRQSTAADEPSEVFDVPEFLPPR